MANQLRNKQKIARVGYLRSHVRQAKESFFELWYRPLGNVLTLAVIAMALSLPSSIYLIGKNITELGHQVASPISVSAYLHEDVSESRIMVFKDSIEGWESVAKVSYISSQQGLSDLSQYAGFESVISLLTDYALPAVLIIEPSIQTESAIREMVQNIRQESIVTDVRLDEDWIARLDAIENLALNIGIILTVLMLSAVFLIVGNTLRFTVLAHKEEIQVMKLIGATDSFILRPYLYSGMWLGLIGAIFAWLLTAMITVLLNSAVEKLSSLYDNQFRLIGLNLDESLLLIMLGLFLGYFAARMSARKHLKEIEPV